MQNGNKLLLLLGPSGVGKSTIIKDMLARDRRFVYVTPYMTRPLRKGETDKISISDAELDTMIAGNQFWSVNTLYGVRYASPK